MPRLLKLGIPPFPVARAQARELIARVDALAGESAAHIEVVQVRAPGETSGGLFVSAEASAASHVETLRRALSRGRVDVVLHHLAERPGGLHADELAAVLERGPQHDVVLGVPLDQLPHGSRIAVGSFRCRALLRHRWPALQPVHLRGGPGTCIQKLRQRAVEALVLPAAVVRWQDEEAGVRQHLRVEDFIPAAGQAALALEVRPEDADIQAWARALEHPSTRLCVSAEAAFAGRVGVSIASGVHARIVDDRLLLRAFTSSFEGESMRVETESTGVPPDAATAASLGAQLAERMLEQQRPLA